MTAEFEINGAYDRWLCTFCGRWYWPDSDHDEEACEAARDEAADHKRRERRENPR